MRLILASASPRRRNLLKQAGYDFTVEVSDAEETLIEGTPADLVRHLSSLKAEAVAARYLVQDQGLGKNHLSDHLSVVDTPVIVPADSADAAPLIVIGADTVVALGDEILGKPEDEQDAFRMLRALSGRTHQVYTGVTLIRLTEGHITGRKTFAERTDVSMREIPDQEIFDYIAGGEPMDKAGAYGIQGQAAVFIPAISGDYSNVVGLPLCRLAEELARL